MKSPLQGLFKNILFVILIFLLLGTVFSLLNTPTEEKKEISITQLVQDINNEKVKEIKILGNDITIKYNDDSVFETKKEGEVSLGQALNDFGVDKEKLKNISFIFEEPSGTGDWFWPLLLFVILPFLMFGFFFFMIFRQAKSGATQSFDFTKPRAKLFGAEGSPKEKITFKDVAGLKEEKNELEEIVDFLKNPEKYLKMGARIPKGALFCRNVCWCWFRQGKKPIHCC